ncbi:MAG: pitrilysin family protein [Planctomycetota bacterium]|nr:pitrilysin family protein [Planctomycetota bacterium]
MKPVRVFCLLLGALLVLCVGPAVSQEKAEKPVSAPLREVLDNGMVVILKEDHGAPILTMQVWLRAGAIYEADMLGSGVSHYVEHMLFKGTKKRAVGQFAQEIKAAGGSLNANTRQDLTVYHVTIQSAFFDKGLDALSDVIMNSSFDEEETKKEKDVIVKELEEDGDDPNMKLYYTFAPLAYQAHPYRHPVGGYLPQFKTITREQLIGYYRKLYVPNNMAFVMVGDFDAKTAMPTIKEAFKDYERKALEPVLIPEEPRQVGMRRAVVTHPNAQICTLRLGFHTISLRDPDLFALDTLALVLGAGETSRLTRKLKYELKLVNGIGAGSHTPQYPGLFYVSTTFNEPEDAARIEEVVLGEIERFKTELISTEELERAKNRVLAEYWFGRQTVEEQAEALGISEFWASNLAFDELYVEGIKKVTPEQVRDVANKYFRADNMTVVCMTPEPEPDDTAGAKTVPTDSTGGVQALPVIVLDNGISLVVKERPVLPLVSICATCLGGLRAETEQNNGVCNIMTNMLTLGTKSRTRAQIAETIEAVGGHIEPTSGRNTFMVSISVLKEHLPLAVELLGDMLMNPSFDEKEFETLKKVALAGLKREAENPFMPNIREIHKMLYGAHPYSMLPNGTIETVSKLTPESLAEFHRAYCRPKNMVIAIIGDVNKDQVVELVGKAFKSFEDASIPEMKLPEIPDQTEAVRKDVQGAQQNLGIGSMAFRTVTMREPDRYAFDVLDSILGSMGGRIFINLRDKEALAYELGCVSRTQLDRGYVWFYIRSTPDKIDKFFVGVRRELDSLVNDPIPAEELERAKNSVIGAYISEQQTNGSQAMSVALDTIYVMGEHGSEKYPDHIRSVTADDIKRIVKTYLAPEKALIVVTKPAEKKGD